MPASDDATDGHRMAGAALDLLADGDAVGVVAESDEVRESRLSALFTVRTDV
jgi:hypothetical protein